MAVLFRIDGTPGPSTELEGGGDFFYDKGVDPEIAAYPAVYVADAMKVASSQFQLNTASPSDWQTCGIWLNPIGSTPGGGSGGFAASHFLNLGQSAGSFYMETTFHPTVQSLADNNYAPLIWLTDPASNQLLGVFLGGTDVASPYLEVFRMLYFGDGSSTWSSLNPDFSFGSEHHPVAGQPYKVRMEWQCGTYNGSTHAFDGWFKVYINDVLVTEQSGIRLNLEFSTNPVDMVGWAAVGFDGTLGPWDGFEIGSIEAPAVPPLQRASYVFFSNAIVEKQAETRLTRTYLQLLAADPPDAPAPVVLTLTEVTGDLYDQEGAAITSGRLHIKPRGPITVDDQLVAAKEVTYDVTGALSINLAASNGVLYDVEFDPDPDDTVTPRNLKPGFFKDVWDIPEAASVDIVDL